MNKISKLILAVFLIGSLIACDSNSKQDPQNEKLSQAQIDSLKKIECDSLLNHLIEIKADTFGHINRVPDNFEESLAQLDTLINDEMKEWIKCLHDGEFATYVHHGFGTYLRNNWGLWGDSKLARNLRMKGLSHPDDMSGIILRSYQRKLKKEKIRFDEQVKDYQDYWNKKVEPVDVDSSSFKQE